MWLSDNLNDDRPSWSPDGKRIAFESEASNGQELDIRIFDTTKPVSLVNPLNFTVSDNLHEGKPVWSPDGKFIYYSKGVASPFEDIVRQPSDQIGVAPTNVVATAEAEYQPALVPQGRPALLHPRAFRFRQRRRLCQVIGHGVGGNHGHRPLGLRDRRLQLRMVA